MTSDTRGDRIRIGLIGCGRHGRFLTSALRGVPGVEWVGCADIVEGAASELAKDVGFAASFVDAGAMIETTRPRAVIVATTHNQLASAALTAIEGGCAVFVEKPLALNAAQGRQVVDAARRAGVPIMVGYCQRYTPVRRRMHELLTAGVVGDIAYVSAGKGSIPHVGWLADPKMGGGQLLFLGSHLTDQVFWLLGQRADRVYAEVNWRKDTGSDNTSQYTIRFAGGVSAQFTCSQAVHASFDYVEVVGSAGRVRADWPTNVLTVHSNAIEAFRDPATIRVAEDPLLPMYVAELNEFVASVREHRAPAITGEDGVRVLEVLDAVVTSGRSGRPVEVGTAALVAGA